MPSKSDGSQPLFEVLASAPGGITRSIATSSAVVLPLPENSEVAKSSSSTKACGLGEIRSKVVGASWKKTSKSNSCVLTFQPARSSVRAT